MTELREIEGDALRLARRIRLLGRPLRPDEEREVRAQSSQIRDRLAQAMVGRLIDDRPEVVSHGKPVAGVAAQRGLEEARRRLRGRDEFQRACSNCPAADVFRIEGGVAVICRVEETRLTSQGDPQSVLTFCMGDYDRCPSWIAEREAVAAGRHGALA